MEWTKHRGRFLWFDEGRAQYRTQLLGEAPHRHLTIERCDGEPVELAWDAVQALKDEAVGEDVFMVEVFPAAAAVVDEVNRRHLWEIDPDLLPFGLHRRGR